MSAAQFMKKLTVEYRISRRTKKKPSSKMKEFINTIKDRYAETSDYVPDKIINTLARFIDYDLDKDDMPLDIRLKECMKLGKDSTSERAQLLRYGKTEGKKRTKKRKADSATTLEKLVAKYGEAEGQTRYRHWILSTVHTLEAYIYRHGETEGPLKHAEYWKNTNFSNSKAAYIRRHGKEAGLKLYDEFRQRMSDYASGVGWDSKEDYRKFIKQRTQSIKDNPYSRDTSSLKSFMRRHGEIEGRARYDKHWKKMRRHNPICVQYYTSKGYGDEEAIDLACKERARRSVPFCRASKESVRRIFYQLYKRLRRECAIDPDDIFWGVGKSYEYRLNDDQRNHFFDFAVPKYKVAVEYNGVVFHVTEGHEHKFHPALDPDANIERFERKLKAAEKNDFTVFVVESVDSNEKISQVIEDIISKIHERQNRINN